MRGFALMLVAGLMASGPARATSVSYAFDFDIEPFFWPELAAGIGSGVTTGTGTVVYDSDTPHAGSLAIAMGGFSASTPIAGVGIDGTYAGTGDAIFLGGFQSVTSSPPIQVNFLQLRFTDPTGTALSSPSVPVAIDLADWETAVVDLVGFTFICSEIQGCEVTDAGMIGTLTSFQVVPEPSSFLLIALGVAALGAARRALR